jgi:hypothetical protein
VESLSPQARRHAGWSRTGTAWLLLLTTLLWLTGLAMHVLARDSVMDMPPWQEQLQRGATVLHGVLTWVFCLAAGRWIWPHIGLVWHRRGHRLIWALGLLALGAGAMMALAGLGLLYGLAAWHDPLAGAHWWLGLVWPLVFTGHAWRRWVRRR